MSDTKIFVGNGKEHVFQDGGSIVKLGFSKKDIQTMIDNMNDGGYCNLVLNKRKQASEHGDTHYMTVDTWVPAQKGQSQHAQTGISASNNHQQTQPQPQQQAKVKDNGFDNFDDDIPF